MCAPAPAAAQARANSAQKVYHDYIVFFNDNETTESLCDGRHLEWLINEFLGELQERDRNIFLQRYWFATPIKEISKKYAMNLNTVKASLFRSRNKLKALLEKEGVLL